MDIYSIEFNLFGNNLIIITLKDTFNEFHYFAFSELADFNNFIFYLEKNKILLNTFDEKKFKNVIPLILNNKLLIDFRNEKKLKFSIIEENKKILTSSSVKEIYGSFIKLFYMEKSINFPEVRNFINRIILKSPHFKKFLN